MSDVFVWSWQGGEFRLGYDLEGEGPATPALLLPAMSTVSTREEMAPLAARLKVRRRVALVDWPGFGKAARPALDITPDLERAFLEAFTGHVAKRLEVRRPVAVGAGHAAVYALDLEARHPGTFSGLVLLAPTWRGPLPTVMGGRKPVQARIRKLVQAPVVGELIYRLNVSRPVVRRMLRGHVFSDGERMVTADLLDDKMTVTKQANARFASACFVTGALDPMPDRAAFLAAAKQVRAPILAIWGADTPPRSRAEMETLAELSNVEAKRLERGALALHEEFPDDLAPLIEAFLARIDAAPASAGVA